MENLTSKLELNYYFENIKRSVFLGIFFLLGFFTFSLIIKSMKQIISLILVTFYFIIRFSFDFFGIELPSYGGYFIDLIAIFLVILINLKSFFAKPIWKFSLIFYTLANLFLGIGIFQIGKFLNYLPPFDFNSLELLVFLLLIGPVLEELLFRFAVWEALKEWIASRYIVLISSMLFSLFHFTVIFNADPSYRGFICYQTIYVFGISLLWGYLRQKSGSWVCPLVAHFLFNLGFYLGTFVPSMIEI
ncbi:MAG: hypothetical protein A2381_09490 [Bdellovibrionales bacterium RIFOXYB1_FULL_37_110]|nr:MAG: hypothetical protein A2417_03005 [Bdellovibrionales bacterium RIFOXYC1_FULL_37_79]OFZ59496.1 MAG: hypothetical protein A2381_09490 [Bdellovibrionales bacterium RIFOXYB1_FULL_37_110]OFZ64215.1 MAG: hypothetical protein A2577_12340 [Bdellovibrionales bacterium RIFOXYD1_FULL_36_51]